MNPRLPPPTQYQEKQPSRSEDNQTLMQWTTCLLHFN